MFSVYYKGAFVPHPLFVPKVILQQLIVKLITMFDDELVYSGLIEMQEMDAPG